MRGAFWRVSIATVALTFGTPAFAANGNDGKALANSGVDHFKKHEYEAARELFARAYALDAAPATLLYLALAELQTSRPVEAAAHFRAYLQVDTEPEEQRADIRSKWLPRAEAQLARVALVVPAGAVVTVDGQPVVQDPSLGLVEVVAGDHDVVVQSAGRSESQHLTAPAGSTLTVRALVDDPPPAAPPPLNVEPAAPLQTQMIPPPVSSAKIATVAALGVGTLAGLGLGIGFDRAAAAKASDINSREGCVAGAPTSIPCQHLTYDVGVEHRDEWISIGSYIGAGVLGAAGIATWFLWPRSPVQVTGSIGSREVSLNATGSW